MKKVIFLLCLSLLFLASCDDKDNNINTTISNVNISIVETTNEPTTDNSIPSNDIPIDNSSEESKTTTTTGNIENGGGYTEDSDEDWIYLG
ncbi:MAG: hypothetical protein IJS83_00020 [Acholeplasmatales bacterium]|nr:hypothetical protein [Acholeplasmatales bacterium]